MSRRFAPALAVLTGALLLVPAGQVSPPASDTARAGVEADARGGTLRLSTPTDFDSLDPALAYRTSSWTIEFATCAKLFNYPDAPGAAGTRLVPEVVKAYTVSRDRRIYDFELKRAFRFHTGAPVTAQSFADAFNRDANPRMRSPATAYLADIVGANAVMRGKAARISGVRVLGRRLQVRLTRRAGDFTARLTMPFFCPILPDSPVDARGMAYPPGSGPYYVAERIVNQRVVLKRNPFYGGGRPANVDRIVITIGETIPACVRSAAQDRTDYCGLFGGLFGLPEAAKRKLTDR